MARPKQEQRIQNLEDGMAKILAILQGKPVQEAPKVADLTPGFKLATEKPTDKAVENADGPATSGMTYALWIACQNSAKVLTDTDSKILRGLDFRKVPVTRGECVAIIKASKKAATGEQKLAVAHALVDLWNVGTKRAKAAAQAAK